MTATFSAAALALILVTEWEGFCAQPYQCPAGVWTIGYGTTRIGGQPVTPTTPRVTEAEAKEMLHDDMRVRMEQVDSLLGTTALTACQRAALYSFAYNVGVGAFRDSTLLRLVRAGRPTAAGEFGRWVYVQGKVSQGLRNRRAAERAMFLGTHPACFTPPTHVG